MVAEAMGGDSGGEMVVGEMVTIEQGRRGRVLKSFLHGRPCTCYPSLSQTSNQAGERGLRREHRASDSPGSATGEPGPHGRSRVCGPPSIPGTPGFPEKYIRVVLGF